MGSTPDSRSVTHHSRLILGFVQLGVESTGAADTKTPNKDNKIKVIIFETHRRMLSDGGRTILAENVTALYTTQRQTFLL